MTTRTPDGSAADPRTRLRAITAELDSAKPRGKEAVLLLVEADQYLEPGTLRQYGEARGCAPEDIAATERFVARKGRGW